MTQVLVVADDLTGVLDSAAVFAGHGLRTLVARDARALAEIADNVADVIGVSTGSRHRGEEGASAAVSAVLDVLGPRIPPIVLKKIDSRLKGQILAETAVLTRRLGRESLVCCPAIPDLGRIVRNGAVAGHGVRKPLPITALGLESLGSLRVLDAQTQGDLDIALSQIVSANDATTTLFIGARGFAQAMAAYLCPTSSAAMVPNLPNPLLLAVGSRDPITQAQVAHLTHRGTLCEVHAPNGFMERGFTSVHTRSHLIHMTAGTSEISFAEAASNFACSVAAVVADMAPRSLLACGGDIADAILQELGVGMLEVLGEISLGVPVSRLPSRGGMTFVTKSGGFGNHDVLAKLIDTVAETV